MRILVHDSASAEAADLARLELDERTASRLVIDLPDDGPDAEGALIDRWLELEHATRARVWCAVGSLAGVLLRTVEQRGAPTAVFGPSCDLLRAPNARSRAILAGACPDSWSLALSAEPPVDASRWRQRLQAAIDVGWSLEWGPPAETRESARGWLDEELTASRPRRGATGPRPTTSPHAQPKAEATPKVLHGKRGRLFLARDTHDSHRQVVGARPLTAPELDAWDHGMRSRQARMAAKGAQLVQLLCPVSQAVHAGDLPEGTALSPDRPAMQLLHLMGSLSPAPQFLYPLDDLVRVSPVHDPFSKTDSHWNDLGAYVAYEHVIDHLDPAIPVRRVPRSAVSFHDTCFTGDLGEKVTPARASSFLRARVDDAPTRLISDNRVRNHGRQGEFECEAAPPTRCVVFGDSCAYPLLLFLAESFRRVVFRHRVNVVDDELVDAERPDLVLVVLTERFCTALPQDQVARPFADVVARKRRDKALLPLPVPDEQPSFQFSIEPRRGLPGGGGFRLPPRDR